MADSKITALTALTAADPVNDMFPVVDVSDTSMAASGTTKRISVNNILGASGTATLASATITGDLTVATSVLKVTTSNVGIGTATPNTNANRTSLTLNNSTWGGQLDINVGAVNHAQFGTDNFGSGLSCRIQSADGIVMKTAGAQILQQISSAGVFTFQDGAGGTRMTLNSFGLGIGIASSSGRLVVRDAGGNDSYIGHGATNDIYLSTGSTGSHYFRKAAASAAMTLDASGNLLVGTTIISPTINGAGAITAKGVAGITLQTVAALATDYTLPIGAFSGILTIRSNGSGGSAVWMLDPNAGAVSISNNIIGRTITFSFSAGTWKMQQTVGVVPSTYNYLVLATQ